MKTVGYKKSRAWPFAILLLLVFLFSTQANALVIDFEDLSPGPVKDGYKSLHWDNASITHSSSGLLDGNVAYGNGISIYSNSLGYFNLESMEIASETTNTIWIEAFAFSDSKFKQEVNLEDLDEVLLDLNLLGITRIDMWSEDNSTFMIDNLKVSWLCGGGECGTVKTSDIFSTSSSGLSCNSQEFPPMSLAGYSSTHSARPTDNPRNYSGKPTDPTGNPPGGADPPPPEPSTTPVPEPSTLVFTLAGMAIVTRVLHKSR